MAGPEDDKRDKDKKGAKPAPASKLSDQDVANVQREMMAGFRRKFLERVVRTRDDLDAGVAKFSSLTQHERMALSVTASMEALMGRNGSPPGQRNELADQFDALSKLFDLDPKLFRAGEQQAALKKVWKEIKPTLDGYIKSDQSDSKAKSKK